MKKLLVVAMLSALSTTALANDSYMGEILGGIAGGVIGNRFGGGSGKVVTTAIGAVIGSQVGDYVENSNARNRNAVNNNTTYYTNNQPIYQYHDVYDASCSCYRRVLVQIN
jgi:uncharacterized protein YcfJ